MDKLGNRLKDNKGAAALILVLAAAVAVMLIIILVPVISGAGESAEKKLDSDYEQAAEDSAYMKYMADGQGFTAIYDSENKDFIDEVGSMRAFGEITAYGESAEHEGKVIMASVDDEGNITLTWIGPEEYWKVNK